MSDTTRRPLIPDAKTPPSFEQSLASAVVTMRQAAADAAADLAASGDDDYWTRWTAEVLDRRPLIFVAAVDRHLTMAWLMEAPSTAPTSEGVLEASARHGRGSDADCPMQTKAHADIAQGVNWLMKVATGEFLRPTTGPHPSHKG